MRSRGRWAGLERRVVFEFTRCGALELLLHCSDLLIDPSSLSLLANPPLLAALEPPADWVAEPLERHGNDAEHALESLSHSLAAVEQPRDPN